MTEIKTENIDPRFYKPKEAVWVIASGTNGGNNLRATV
jgi:hypothetical protein